jgi:hypothetical protein
MTLDSLGWNAGFAAAFRQFTNDSMLPARVALEHKHAYELLSPMGGIAAECTGGSCMPLVHAASCPRSATGSRSDCARLPWALCRSGRWC